MINSLTLKYCILLVCIFAIAAGQILFKLSANTVKETNSILSLAFEPWFLAAILLYGCVTLGWVWCLQEVPLSRAYLFMSLAFVLVPVMGALFFGETLTWKFFLSALLIVSGIIFSFF
jgi:drug/metabolite transporter (DMT)-like permease